MLMQQEVHMFIKRSCQFLGISVFIILSIMGRSGADIWQDQRPLRIEGNLQDIQFVGQHGWIAGGIVAGSVVYHTYDGGVTWQKEVPLPYGYHLNALYFVDNQNGWAVGKSGEIMHTSDGANWMSQISGTTGCLRGVYFTDNLRGFAVGDGVILETSDAGTTWVLNAVDAYLENIYFIDALHGWTCGWIGKIFYTSDGGASWNSIGDITGYDLTGIYFSDSLHGWVVGSTSLNDGCIFMTQDGGYTWSSQYVTNFHLSAIFGLDSLRLWVSSSQRDRVLFTTDGGSYWSQRALPVGNGLKGLFFFDSLTGWLVGSFGCLLNTQDGGNSWSFWGDGPSNNLNYIDFIDNTRGWITGYPEISLNTTDSGNHWEILSAVSGPIDFVTATFGFRAYHYQIFRTSDGGINWEYLYTHPDSSFWGMFNAIYAVDTLHAWVCGGVWYTEMRPPLLVATMDGGETWIDQSGNGPFANGDQLVDISFLDSLNGWVVGWRGGMGGNGIVFKTIDGGITWDQVYLATTESYYHSVQFFNSANGLVAGAMHFCRTTDGGAHWQEITGWGGMYLKTFCFLNMNEGWIGKTHGEIVHTTDGGTSWLTDSTPTTKHINDIFFSDPDHGWAVGEGGIVMAYNQGSWIQEPCAPSAYAKFSIKQNPFRDKVTMLISVSYGTPVSLKVYNLEGRLIGTVLSGFYSPGTYEVKWDARDARGEEIPSGTYFAILRVGSEISVKKVVHLR